MKLFVNQIVLAKWRSTTQKMPRAPSFATPGTPFSSRYPHHAPSITDFPTAARQPRLGQYHRNRVRCTKKSGLGTGQVHTKKSTQFGLNLSRTRTMNTETYVL